MDFPFIILFSLITPFFSIQIKNITAEAQRRRDKETNIFIRAFVSKETKLIG